MSIKWIALKHLLGVSQHILHTMTFTQTQSSYFCHTNVAFEGMVAILFLPMGYLGFNQEVLQ
jgi:hypothetical protein